MASFTQIKASAGSGKTYTLTKEYISRLLSLGRRSGGRPNSRSSCSAIQGFSAAEILAITFTNAAAAEMRERAIIRLKEAALSEQGIDGISPQEAAKWLDELLRDMSSLNIRTIDSLLLLIVRTSALTLGLNPEFSTGLASEEILDPYLEEFLERARNNPESRNLLRNACAALVDPSRHSLAYGKGIADLLSRMLNNALMEKFDSIAAPVDIENRINALGNDLADAADSLLNMCSATSLTMNKRARDKLEQFAAKEFPDDLGAWLSKENGTGLFNKKPAIPEEIVRSWQNFTNLAKEYLDSVPSLRAGLKLLPFIEVATRIANEFRENMSGEGILPAALIPAYAGKALRSGYGVSDALCRLGNRLMHFLVDEFQDTSRQQWNVLQPLALEALSRGGSLTYVGDVKQSIYGWRQAEPGLFMEVLTDPELGAVSEETETRVLPANWRSARAIVEHNNLLFGLLDNYDFCLALLGEILPKTGFPDTVKEEAARKLANVFKKGEQECVRNEPQGYVSVEQISASAEDLDDAVTQRLCELVKSIHERRPWSDILVLVRNNIMGANAAEALVCANVPVVTENSLRVAENPLVIQSVAFLSFLDNPRNDVAFWTLVSGSIFLDHPWNAALTLEELLDWAVERPGMGLQRSFAEQYPESWQKIIRPFFNQASLMTPYDMIMEWYAFLDVENRFPEDKTFLRRFLEILQKAEEKGFASMSSFLEFWSKKGNQEKTPMPENMDAVRVMTIHKAKGLESPVTVVPWTNFGIKPSDEYAVVEKSGLHVPALLKRKSTGREYYEDYARQAMEAVNLLYVALTRSREELYVFREKKDSGNSRVMGLGKALDALVEGIGKNYPYEWGELPGAIKVEEMARAEKESTPQNYASEPPEWRPMQWLPQMKIFRNRLARETMTGEQRGIFIHACLERLHFRSNPEDDARDAMEFTLRNVDMGIQVSSSEKKSILKALIWFASLPQAREWISSGTPERSMINSAGELIRADRIIPLKSGALILEYKTGQPDEKYPEQMRGYISCLKDSGEIAGNITGLLLYLDLQYGQIVTTDSQSELFTDFSNLDLSIHNQ